MSATRVSEGEEEMKIHQMLEEELVDAAVASVKEDVLSAARKAARDVLYKSASIR